MRRGVDGRGNHSYALLIVAGFAVAMALVALRDRRAGATALVLLGATALYIALAIDLPDTRARGRLPESISFEAAHARAAGGLYLEIAGGGLLVVAGWRAAGAGTPGAVAWGTAVAAPPQHSA